MYHIDEVGNRLLHGAHVYDPVARRWIAASDLPAGRTVPAAAALLWLQSGSGHPLREPVGVVGPRDADADTAAIAEQVGALLGGCRLTLLCGGGPGVMEAASRGATTAGGLAIGLLPGRDAAEANAYAGVVLASGIGEARNAIIATASRCLVAVGDSFGTLSEVAFARRLDKPVFGMAGAAKVDGVVMVDRIEDLAGLLADAILGPVAG